MNAFILGLAVGVVVGASFTYSVNVREVLNECEKNLPRTQDCFLTAIPEPGIPVESSK